MGTYQVLARKWRPHNFQTIVGQDHVVTALTRALTEKRLHHAYLFTGTRGVGKTTISRIFAKALNCQGVDGKGDVTAEPCGVCPACRAIDEGNFSDYIEMDAASNRSVEDMTALLERAMYAPTEGRYKVYMIDEVHMLSTTAFNAMLKTLEEPPEYVKFILATTDPQKVPITVLSRCLQFNLRNMTPSGIVSHMTHILETEGIAFETPALRLLAQGARGSMRDGLSLLDQAIAYCASGVTEAEVRAMLGMSGTELLTELFEKLLAGDARGMMGVADEMLAQSLSFAQVLRDMASVVHRAALVQRVPEAVGPDDPEKALVERLASACAPEEIQLVYQILLHGRNDLHLAPDEYAGFTMTLLRMLAFKPAGLKVAHVPERKLAAREGASTETRASAPASAPTPTPAPAQTRPAAPADVRPAAPKPVSPVPSVPPVSAVPPHAAAGPASAVPAVGSASGLPPIDVPPMPEDLPPWGEPDAG